MSSSLSPANKSGTAAYRELVERIATSRAFRKSARQRQLLTYLADRAINEPGCDIAEQEIGEALFARPAGYDTSADTIVRVNVYELRKKLQSYFDEEGKNEPILIEIPKGGYCPVFTARLAAAAASPESRRNAPIALYGFAALSVLLALACGALAIRNAGLGQKAAPAQSSPAVWLLWSRLIGEGRSTDVVLADSNLSFLQDIEKRPLPAPDYFRGSYFAGAEKASAHQREMLELFMSRRYTSMADVHVLQRILLMSGADPSRINVHFARDFSPEDLKTSNVVLVGSKRANPWAQFFESGLNFRFEHDEAAGYGDVVNVHPKAGESARYLTSKDGPMLDSYGVVAFLPNLAGTGNVLLLAGAGMHATASAGELVTNENFWTQALRKMDLRLDAPLPYFELLLKTRVMGATMQPPQIVSWRLHH